MRMLESTRTKNLFSQITEICKSAEFSSCELRDSGGKKYIDLVLQGGGMLGIAHLGIIAGLEAANVRFLSIAGTSAGAIIAVLVAASRTSIDEPCAETLTPILLNLPADEFCDGPYVVRRAISRIKSKSRNAPANILEWWRIGRRLVTNQGLNPGDSFSRWLTQILTRKFNINSLQDLDNRLATVPPFPNSPKVRGQMGIIATGIPLGLKFVFPWDVELLRKESLTPADFVRASMSIPFFFEPFRIKLNLEVWQQWINNQKSLAKHERAILGEISEMTFVDGGLLSNFPVDVFETPTLCGSSPQKIGKVPLVGVSMTPTVDAVAKSLPSEASGINQLTSFSSALMAAMRSIRDREATSRLSSNQRASVYHINVGHHDWLDFSMSKDDQLELYEAGLATSVEIIQWLAT